MDSAALVEKKKTARPTKQGVISRPEAVASVPGFICFGHWVGYSHGIPGSGIAIRRFGRLVFGRGSE